MGRKLTDALKITILDEISIQNSLSKILNARNGGKWHPTISHIGKNKGTPAKAPEKAMWKSRQSLLSINVAGFPKITSTKVFRGKCLLKPQGYIPFIHSYEVCKNNLLDIVQMWL